MSNMRRSPPGSQRMPENSIFYERAVPIILVVLAALFVLVLAAAAAAVMGWIRF